MITQSRLPSSSPGPIVSLPEFNNFDTDEYQYSQYWEESAITCCIFAFIIIRPLNTVSPSGIGTLLNHYHYHRLILLAKIVKIVSIKIVNIVLHWCQNCCSLVLIILLLCYHFLVVHQIGTAADQARMRVSPGSRAPAQLRRHRGHYSGYRYSDLRC